MILVILGISILLIVAGIIWINNCRHDDFAPSVTIVAGAVVTVISAIVTLCLIGEVVQLSTIDKKIAMYETENNEIENQIAEVVTQYQQYEKEIFTEVAPESSITLASLYPELKSDTLVQKQIEVYTKNNEHIKTLKCNKINGDIVRWWLYFGGDI